MPDVWIERLKIEGGVLDGFEQHFSQKLNVLIGGRGTGKSSIIELIRFCLGAVSYTSVGQSEAMEHALGVLGDGKVSVILTNGREEIAVSRTAMDDHPDASGPFNPPFVFSQSEIESIGLQAVSRLRLIDGFLPHEFRRPSVDTTTAKIRSATTEIRAMLSEIDDINEKVAELPALRAQLEKLKQSRTEQSVVHSEIESLRVSLEEILPQMAVSSVRGETINRAYRRMSEWISTISIQVNHYPSLETWPAQAGKVDELAEVRSKERAAIAQINAGVTALLALATELAERSEVATRQRSGIENRARDIRQKMEERQKGASALDKQIGDLTQRISVLQSLVEVKQQRESRVGELIVERQSLLNIQENRRQERTKARVRVASDLTKDLAPTIRIAILPYAQRGEYISALVGALRGSGLRYAELSERIANVFSPQEIASIAEERKVGTLKAALEIADERAIRLCEALRADAGADIFSVVVEDDVEIELMDGADFKGVDFLSMGQRCTAILPIIMRHTERIVILDQPEDHLDNAFIVGTLVRSISSRSKTAQTLVATHNPNIPVIGSADKVVHMDSDGTRCFCRTAGHLEHPPIIEAITTIMEGGRDAFARRAKFYEGAEDDVFG